MTRRFGVSIGSSVQGSRQQMRPPAARQALAAFGVEPAELRFVNLSENVTFRAIDGRDGSPLVLRLHRPPSLHPRRRLQRLVPARPQTRHRPPLPTLQRSPGKRLEEAADTGKRGTD